MSVEKVTDAFGEELKVGDEIIYKYEWGFSKGVITHIDCTQEDYTKWIVVYFYKRSDSWLDRNIEKGLRSKVQTANCVKIS